MNKCKIISFVNHKGGVGKTTSVINISTCFSILKKHVLLVDFDPQGNASKGLGFDPSSFNYDLFDVLNKNIDIEAAIKPNIYPNLDLLAGRFSLSYLNENISEKNRLLTRNFKEQLKTIKNKYDFIIIDCPPSLGSLSTIVLNVSDSVIIPIQCESFALDATTQILGTIANIQQTTNKSLMIEGFILTMYDSKGSLCEEICSRVREIFKENTFATVIPRIISIPESLYKGIPVNYYRPTSIGATSYMSLAKEILEKNLLFN